MSLPVLECRQIYKSFGGVTVLNNVDFILEKGEIHALVGQNGAGKSTLMKIINGVYTQDSGTILIEGKEQIYKSAQEARRAGISMVFQDFSLVPTLSVSQNIFLARELSGGHLGLDDRRMEEITQKLLDSIGIDISIHPRDYVENLSVGSKQLVEIAKALSTDSKILIFDEPTVGLDPTQIVEIRGLIRRLAENSTVLFSTHILSEVEALCDRAIILINGQVRADARLSELAATSDAILVLDRQTSGVQEALGRLDHVRDVSAFVTSDGYPAFRTLGSSSTWPTAARPLHRRRPTTPSTSRRSSPPCRGP